MELGQLQQQRRFVVDEGRGNAYRVFTGDQVGNPVEPVGHLEQHREQGLKQQLVFYVDEDRTEVLLRCQAGSASRQLSSYEVSDPQGTPLGTFGRDVKRSLVASTWRLEPVGLTAYLGRDNNKVLAALRRVRDPAQYSFFDGIWTQGLRAYTFTELQSQQPALTMARQAGWSDPTRVEIADDRLDRRLVIALTVVMAGLQLAPDHH
ncbi:hypothetical protein ACQB60_44965 [Actinomycetota bacterium Odt1-20B]